MRILTFVWFKRFAVANSGAIAPLFAICLVAVGMASGLAVDYSLSFSAKTKLQAAADAAALAMVSQAAQSDGSDEDIHAAKEKGYLLYADLLSKEALELRQPPRLSLSRTVGRYDATVIYSAEQKVYFAGLFSRSKQLISGRAVASQQSTFVDLHLVLDVSASMGLGASEDDQRRLQQQTGCQFGCHVAEGGPSNEQRAIDLGIPMRIDVLKSATHQLVDEMAANENAASMRISLHTFHDKAEQVLPPTNDFAQAKSTVDQFRLAMGRPRTSTNPGGGMTPDSGDTQPAAMAKHLSELLGTQGHGTRNDPRRYVVLVTDGTDSTWSPGLSTRPWDPDTCQPIKDLGVDVAVVYLEYSYYGKETDGTWPWAIAPIEAQIEPNLKACSTKGLYVKANDPNEIHIAFSSLFQQIVKRAEVRLTN